MNRRTGLVTLIVAISVVCVAGAGTLASADPVNNSTAADAPTITVENQTTNGTTVSVENVTLPDGGFVSVHNRSYLPPANESVTSVLGASKYLTPGHHEDVTVVLDQPLSENHLVVARASRDGNSNQSFDYVSSQGFVDTGYSRNDTGTAVTDHATVRVKNATSLAKQATIAFANQSTNGTNVTIANVTVPEGGFVGVHNPSFLPPENKTQESMIGASTYLTPGVHHNVTIPLNSTLEENTSLLATPYQDTNGNESFEFVASDAQNDTPYSLPGSTALVAQANVTINTSSSTATEAESEADTSSPRSASGFASITDYVEIGAFAVMVLLCYLYLKLTK